MFVSGFTIVRNAVRYDYPIVESIRSLLPLVDEMVVAIGDSEDGTREKVVAINSPKCGSSIRSGMKNCVVVD